MAAYAIPNNRFRDVVWSASSGSDGGRASVDTGVGSAVWQSYRRAEERIGNHVCCNGDGAAANGINIALDAQIVADIKALIQAIEAYAKPAGVSKPAANPALK